MIDNVKFEQYEKMLRDWSARMNLVAPSTLADIKTRHFADSAQLANLLPRDAQIVDLGSGAGFPGVVLAILGWRVTCIESIGKKAAFLSALKDELDLPNLTVFHGRVEDYIKKLRPVPENLIFTARAFASLTKILDYVAPANRQLFLLKGRDIASEIDAAKQKYKFDYELVPSKTGDGFVIIIKNCRLFHVK